MDSIGDAVRHGREKRKDDQYGDASPGKSICSAVTVGPATRVFRIVESLSGSWIAACTLLVVLRERTSLAQDSQLSLKE